VGRSTLPALDFHSQSPSHRKIAALELGSTVNQNLDGRDRSRPDGYARSAASSVIGSERIRLPVAAKIALHSAGAMGGKPGSPTPPNGMS
jgi:hypothetical protein